MENMVIEHNPMLKQPILLMLDLAEEASDRATLEEAALAQWKSAYSQSPATIIDVLERAGSLEVSTFVDGEPYEGALEDLQMDETVPDDAAIETRVQVTDAGRALAEAYRPDRTLAALMADRPQYHDIFCAVLSAAASGAGASRMDLEAAINAYPAVKPDAQSGQTKVYPQYFIDALETAGGIAWDGAWRTTEVGRAILAA